MPRQRNRAKLGALCPRLSYPCGLRLPREVNVPLALQMTTLIGARRCRFEVWI